MRCRLTASVGKRVTEAFDSQGSVLVFERAFCDGVVGSKRTHMGGYVEQAPIQCSNGQPTKKDAPRVRQ